MFRLIKAKNKLKQGLFIREYDIQLWLFNRYIILYLR